MTLLADVGGMTTNHRLIQDSICLDTPTTRRIRRHVELLALRDPDIGSAVRAVLDEDDQALLRLVRRAQAGDQDAALTAIAALLPRMTGAVIKTNPLRRRRRAIDEYVALAFLVIANIDEHEPAKHLAKKVVARTRLRYERQLRMVNPSRVWPGFSGEGPASSVDVELEALARLDVTHMADAVKTGLVSAGNWQLVTAAGMSTLDRPLNERQRQTVVRTRRKLTYWYGKAEAA